jgi:hypothetical protein
MKHRVELDIDVAQASLAELYANPALSPQWMDDIARYEPLQGTPGSPGSTYRLVPKSGSLVFVATVVSRDLPNEVVLNLDSPSVTVSVVGRLIPLSESRTRLVSEETFRFRGMVRRLVGVMARPAIAKAHRRHMEAFKAFAEAHAGSEAPPITR